MSALCLSSPVIEPETGTLTSCTYHLASVTGESSTRESNWGASLGCDILQLRILANSGNPATGGRPIELEKENLKHLLNPTTQLCSVEFLTADPWVSRSSPDALPSVAY